MNLSHFRNIHKNRKAFLVACGPSLNDIDPSTFKDELVFGVSLSYKKREIKSDYHFMGDYNIASQFYKEIYELK